MPIIELSLDIAAPPERVFDLSRSIDLHEESTAQTNEKAVAGRTSGLMELGETVTWRAKHFGVYQHLTSKMTELEYPSYFVDEMVSGAFKRFRHEHYFEPISTGTRMRDIFDYTSPLGILGIFADRLFLEKYMRELLETRNQFIKSVAERA
ncbi:MAG: SRPBCC family protein [Bacteroidota bacterium]